jgi:hypothetical protein
VVRAGRHARKPVPVGGVEVHAPLSPV